jgi:hypothetical protein
MAALGFEERRHKRRSFAAIARITDRSGAQPMRCEIADISEGGARLLVPRPELVSELGTLWLSSNGAVKRIYRVVRRGSKDIGVKFV